MARGALQLALEGRLGARSGGRREAGTTAVVPSQAFGSAPRLGPWASGRWQPGHSIRHRRRGDVAWRAQRVLAHSRSSTPDGSLRLTQLPERSALRDRDCASPVSPSLALQPDRHTNASRAITRAAGRRPRSARDATAWSRTLPDARHGVNCAAPESPRHGPRPPRASARLGGLGAQPASGGVAPRPHRASRAIRSLLALSPAIA
jgi:hypothetical protein